ncbi:MAG: hypothetical protein H6755_07460 [Candidatus Omnitrophica bacterium]|nr:hypothetical protein [Candidatus Omnitrophota bacterium]MCB9748229.1 hypothetical protein [Candidatus Omnitrophota bacterium]
MQIETKTQVETIVFIAVYSKDHCLGMRDILESLRVYCPQESFHIFLINTSSHQEVKCILETLVKEYKDLTISLSKDACTNDRGEFYYLVSKYMQLALDNYQFKSFLKMDPDALITGFGLLYDINTYFADTPAAGSLGSYKYNCQYQRRDFRNWEPVFAKEGRIWRKYLKQMQGSNYIIGEHAQGGVEVYSYACIERFHQQKLLMADEFRSSKVIVDVLLSFLVRFSGFEIHSFVDDGYPFAIAYQGMPMSIFKIREKNKKIIHSLKFSWRERLIRQVFAVLRWIDFKRMKKMFNPVLNLKRIS